MEQKERFQVRQVDYTNEALSYDEHNNTQTSVNSYNNDSTNLKSLPYYTRDAGPKIDHYRNILSVHGHAERPTLDELHRASIVSSDRKKSIDVKQLQAKQEKVGGSAIKFGWIQGVFIRCLLNIWGVMLFLRLSWVVGKSGIGCSFLIIIISSVVTVLTTLSMAAICTNGEVKGGGIYYMISRSLGPEFGGSIGLIFSLANAVSISMYAVGFAETVRDILIEYDAVIIDGGTDDVRIIAIAAAFLMLAIVLIGTEWESKTQMVLLVILLSAMVNFVVGSFIEPSKERRAKGFVGWNAELMTENLGPDYRGDSSFFSVFSVFFPATTGITAGANISGDLKNPSTAIPKGTLLAIFVSSVSYLLLVFISGSTVLRDANGIVNGTLEMWEVRNCSLAAGGKCLYGLSNSFQATQLGAANHQLIWAGIFAASLSSALASLVSAPKVFQALCNDKLFPYIDFFGKPYGRNGEPRRAYLLAFFIAVACCAIGTLNNIAPIISNFFLAAYTLINFACFHASFVKSPGFRPAFKYYNMWLSLGGAAISITVMFIIQWEMALATFGIIIALYIFISYRNPDVNWGASTQGQLFKTALNSVARLNFVHDHIKNYRPQLLLLTGNPSSRPTLVDFAACVAKSSLLMCGHVLQQSQGHRFRETLYRRATHWLLKKQIKGFYNVVEDQSLSKGVHSLLQLVGVGKLRPNTLCLGFKSDWQNSDGDALLDYFQVLHVAFDLQMSVMILRLPEGLDYSSYGDYEELKLMESLMEKQKGKKLEGEHHESSSGDSTPNSSPVIGRSRVDPPPAARIMRGLSRDVPREVLTSVNRFQKKQKGTIDVWWLYDDGGLTMLIPFIVKKNQQWESCKLRVFTLANKKEELDRTHRNMASLLSKFRIDYSDVTVIPDITKKPQKRSELEFSLLLENWCREGNQGENDPLVVTEAELLALQVKTNRHLRLREMLNEHSKDATLIIMTLPMPRKNAVSAPMYMAWLDHLTRDMPPFLFIRGNQTSVLTFYS